MYNTHIQFKKFTYIGKNCFRHTMILDNELRHKIIEGKLMRRGRGHREQRSSKK